MTLTTTSVRDIPPVRHGEAMELASAEYRQFTALLHTLAPGDWNTPTACDRGDVRAMAAHVLGAAEACASIRENVHQLRLGHRVQRQLGLGHIVQRHGLGLHRLRPRTRHRAPRQPAPPLTTRPPSPHRSSGGGSVLAYGQPPQLPLVSLLTLFVASDKRSWWQA